MALEREREHRERRRERERESDRDRLAERSSGSGASPYLEDDMARARLGFLKAHATPQSTLVLSKAFNVLLVVGLLVSEFRIMRLDGIVASSKPVIVRVNDVGRAEVVRLDKDYIPEEPEVRDCVERLAIRMFSRSGFTLPEALETNGYYLAGQAREDWYKSAKADLEKVAALDGLCRVRILSCRIENLDKVKTPQGATAFVRFATDGLTTNGTVVPNTAVGFEMSMRFQIGAYPSISDPILKDRWIVRNPLGFKSSSYQVVRYMGPDVPMKDTTDPLDVSMPGKTSTYADSKNVPRPPDMSTAQNVK